MRNISDTKAYSVITYFFAHISTCSIFKMAHEKVLCESHCDRKSQMSRSNIRKYMNKKAHCNLRNAYF